MTAGEIGWILAVPLIGRAVTGPLSGVWADRFHRYRTPMVLLALAATAAYFAMSGFSHMAEHRFAAFLILYAIGYTGITNITPLLDAMTLQLSRLERFPFGLARAAGSASFVFATISLGYLMQLAGAQAAVTWMIVTAALTCLAARFLLPPHPRLDIRLAQASHPVTGGGRLKVLMSHKGYILLVIAVGCLQAAHSYYYAFSTIIWEKRGLSSNMCGLLWGTAVAGELIFLSFGGRLRQRLGPWRLLLIGAAAGVLRWSLMMTSPPLAALWPLQLLHGLSFGAVYLAGLELVHLLVPPGFEGLGQTLNSAYAGGALIGLGTLASGTVFDAMGEGGYGLMALLSLAGLACSIWLYLARGRLVSAVTLAPASSPGGKPAD